MKRPLLAAAGALAALLAPSFAAADVKTPSVFSSHMVLQRDKPIVVWGWADPDESVTVAFGGKHATGKADDKGNWRVKLPTFKASAKPRTMTVKGKNTLTFKDVLVGEVWLGSGQSNMEWSLAASADPQKTIAAADHPQIRLLHVKKVQTDAPAKDVTLEQGWKGWRACTPKSVTHFSAVLYHFGARIHKELDVPVGLINSSWGGSPIDQWLVNEKHTGKMYNAMIAPLQSVALRGLLWYQGESNMGEGLGYAKKQADLIASWRRTFGQELPFYYVQIAPFSGYGKAPLANLWEAQTSTLKIPGTGMAVVTDLVDNVADIHPRNKKDVGNRLALWALAKTYGKKDVVYSGPLYRSMKVEGDKVRISFAHTGGGLKSRDDKPLTEFEVAGEDGKFHPAEAMIDGKTVVVHARGIDKPTQVRFGWRNVANPNLMNAEGLPASPFQTNKWTGGTGE